MMPSALIVEDNPMVARLHEELLRSSGFTTRVAKNGHEAVDIVGYLGERFDVIFMNKKMPIMDGVMATMMLRAMDVKSLIVGVTAAEETERMLFIEAGLDECFETPLNSEKIAKVFYILGNAGYLTN